MTQMPSKSTPHNPHSSTFESSLPIGGEAIAGDRLSADWEPSPEPEVPHTVEPELDEKPASPSPLLAPLRWWQGISIRRKATGLAIALGTVPLIGFGVVSYVSSSEQIASSVATAQEELAIATSKEVSLFMAERYGDILILAEMGVFTDPQLRQAASTQEEQAQLESFLKTHSFYSSIALFDLYGNVITTVGGETAGDGQGNNVKDQDYFQAVMQTNRAAISQPSSTDGEASIFIAAPVKDTATSETIAIIRTQIPISYLSQFLQETKVAEVTDIEYNLVGVDGKFFATADGEEIGQEARLEIENFDQLAAARQPATATAADEVEGNRQIVSYAPIVVPEGMPELNWSILLAEDTTTAFSAQRSLVLSLVLGLGLTALVVSAIARFLADRATYPILDAAEAVERIGQGELETRLEFQGTDEVATLGSNINSMATRLQLALNAQAFESAQERLLTAAKGTGVMGRADLQGIFDQAVEEARLLLNFDRIVIYRFDTGSGRGIVAESAVADLPSALEDNVNDTCIPDRLREAYRQGRVVATRDVAEAD